MFTLKLYDRQGTELNQGDIVKISNGKRFTFFAEVKWLEKEQLIAPFHTFCFHSFEKVDKVPDNAKQGTEERYKIWHCYDDEAEEDLKAPEYERYLLDWRKCETEISKGVFKISPPNNH